MRRTIFCERCVELASLRQELIEEGNAILRQCHPFPDAWQRAELASIDASLAAVKYQTRRHEQTHQLSFRIG